MLRARSPLRALLPIAIALSAPCALPVLAAGMAGEIAALDSIEVSGQRRDAGADSATIGTVYAEQFEHRPLSRPGELLEVVPGLIVTQHSGEGKANQYFLRGFNLDHGTDFATFVDGVPINLPTHAHGQGYTDLNFLIPELVDSVEYRKGPYYADFGDFSPAGAAELRFRDRFEQPFVQASGGAYGYGRLLAAGSTRLAGGDFLYGLEGAHYDGPWTQGESLNRQSGVLRWSSVDERGGVHVTALGYNARWRAVDQIPQRAVDQGLIDRLGCLGEACSDGGKTHRYSLSAAFEQRLGAGQLLGNAYAYRYKLDLYSNFTYFLDDPVNGDQFEQFDARNVYGGRLVWRQPLTLAGLHIDAEAGAQTRYDDIGTVGLYRTRLRERLATTSEASVGEWGSGGWGELASNLLPWLRATAGLRLDHYAFDVDAHGAPQNSGSASAQQLSPKFALVAGPFAKTELFLNLGRGFHTNDARGTTQTTEPTDPTTPVQKVSPIVAARGIDLGLRSRIVPNVTATLSLFALHIDSELTFSGDAGSTEANRPSERRGLEASLFWRPRPQFVIDADYAYTHARFRDAAPEGRRIPEAVTSVFALGGTWQSPDGWFAAARLRYFGPRPLIEDGSVRSNATTLVNADAGYQFTRGLRASLQVLNLFDSQDHDIDYYFPSRISSAEPVDGVPDIHFHPVEPRNVRVVVRYDY